MWASLNLLALLGIAILALAFGDRTVRIVSIIILLGVVATIFVQRITRSYDPVWLLMAVDSLMMAAFFVVAVGARRWWCWAVFMIQGAIVGLAILNLLDLVQPPEIYLHIVAVLTYLHVAIMIYALFDRYFGRPHAPPPRKTA